VGRLSVLSTLKRPTPEVQNTVTGSNPFSPKNPHFDLPKPQNATQNVFTGHIHYRTLNHTQGLRLQHQIIKIHQLTKLLQLSTTTTISSPLHQFMIPNASIHQQHMLKQQQQRLNMNSSSI
jgi:hypothetical protein